MQKAITELYASAGSPDYNPLEAYREFAKTHTNGDMLKTYLIVSALAEMSEMNSVKETLKWQQLPIHISNVNTVISSLHSIVKGAEGTGYNSTDAQMTFANEYVNDDLNKAYAIASALAHMLNEFDDDMVSDVLGWKGVSILLCK